MKAIETALASAVVLLLTAVPALAAAGEVPEPNTVALRR